MVRPVKHLGVEERRLLRHDLARLGHAAHVLDGSRIHQKENLRLAVADVGASPPLRPGVVEVGLGRLGLLCDAEECSRMAE